MCSLPGHRDQVELCAMLRLDGRHGTDFGGARLPPAAQQERDEGCDLPEVRGRSAAGWTCLRTRLGSYGRPGMLVLDESS